MKLGDVATYVNGYPFQPAEWSDHGVPIIRIQNLTGNSYQTNLFSGTIDERYQIHTGDILISWSASLGVYTWKQGDAVLNQHIFKVVFNKSNVDKSFFVHQVRNLLQKSASAAHGATMKHLTKPVFDSLPFFLPSDSEQKRIAATLDHVSKAIVLHEQLIKKLDQLAKSRFIEMFGNPCSPSNNFTLSMPNVCKIIDGDRGKNYPSQEDFFESGYCLFLNAKNVTQTGFQFDNRMFITAEKDSILRKGKLERGDVVLTTRGTVGNIAFYDNKVPYEHMRINSGMVILRMKHSLVSETFFIEQFKILLASIKQHIASGSAQPQLPISSMNQIRLIVPPLALQNEFAAFIEQLDKSKLAARNDIEVAA